MNTTRIFSTLFLVLSLQFSARAFHLIGGELTYQCLGNGDYEFLAKLYRDCNCTDCAQLDASLPISIFECGDNINCPSLDQGDQIHHFYVRIEQIEQVEPPDYPCYIPPDVCTEVGVYRWKLSDFGINLPNSAENYILTFQRCCRNATVNNLNNPASQGATYTTEITSAAQANCNSSAIFEAFPPTVICAGVPLEFDHSATDADGDVLVYELCSPLIGGAVPGGGAPMGGCFTTVPDPPCPPPYPQVSYQIGVYSGGYPLPAAPRLAINRNTGLLTGTPTLQGQYVVGVCVTEYRDGEIINRVFRDFQFNVTTCEPIVETLMKADEIDLITKEFTINSCGENTVKFKNESFKEIFIDEFRWEFEIGGQTQIFTEWSPEITFPELGNYQGRLFLNPGFECSDTAYVSVNILPEVIADFDFEYDTCRVSDVSFFDQSTVFDSEIYEWFWRLGDGTTSDIPNPMNSYTEAGTYPILLAVRDTNNCQAVLSKDLLYFPLPEEIVIAPNAAIGCRPVEIFFDNLTSPIDENYEISWDFGDGFFSDELSPSHLYEAVGDYTVVVELVSPAGCRTDTVFTNLIRVNEVPTARFSWTPEELTTFNSTAEFTDESIDAARREWIFNQGSRIGEANPTFTFRDTGRQQIQLIAISSTGCADTAFAEINIFPKYTFYLPNAFTPNFDTKNDTYIGVGYFEAARNYNMTIWNRWGEKIFETTDPTEGWNGRKFNTGKDEPQDVYTVRVTFEGGRGAPLEFLGKATLVR